MSIKNLLSENNKEQDLNVASVQFPTETGAIPTPISIVESFTSDITWVIGNGTPVTITDGLTIFKINEMIWVSFKPFTLTSGTNSATTISSSSIPTRFNSLCPISSTSFDFVVIGGIITTVNITHLNATN